MAANRLTDLEVRGAKAKEKPYKLFDGEGLFLLVSPTRAPGWRFKYAFGGREKLLSLGTYPEVSLAEARARKTEFRKQVRAGQDPSAMRQAERLAASDTLEQISRDWLKQQEHKLEASTLRILRRRLEKFVFPYLGRTPIAEVNAAKLLGVLRRIESRGRHDTAHRTRALVGRIMRFAVATGRAERDASADLRGTDALAPVSRTSRAALIDPARVGGLLRAIDDYDGQPQVRAALQLAPLLFVRPGELRGAEWSEFDLDAGTWRIPAARMKMKEQHLVPLARQAVAILRDLERLTGSSRYVFPSIRTPAAPLSDGTMNAALRTLGYASNEQSSHGFRTTASTLLNEQGFAPDLIELQLAHKERNKVRAAYNRAERIAERRQMMQAWADYLDGLKAGGRVIPIRRAKR